MAQKEKQSAAKGGIAAEGTIETTPLRRSYVVEPEMVRLGQGIPRRIAPFPLRSRSSIVQQADLREPVRRRRR
ncbi:hypothetical protein [Bradyrhizobium sp. RDI18]|uniref:hypothetical protein n=1 Tax=Bradyrhizobium sp. RDI18 TaxID=3367400 RepID=UPI00371130FA